MTQALLGVLLAAPIAAAAYRVRVLSFDGAMAAFAVGAIVFGAAGWRGAVLLFAFFVPSAALSRLGRERKRMLRDAGKLGPRDARQVLANGGVAACCALLGAWGNVAFGVALAGAFAAASADTWGTEIGTLARGRPISILTLRRIPTGLSGGITPLGSLATIAGAAVVALAARATHAAPFAAVAAGGLAGALLDSVLGASVQALRRCPACNCDCETNPHACGSPTHVRRGYAWIENDAVNFAATLGGALIAVLAVSLSSR